MCCYLVIETNKMRKDILHNKEEGTLNTEERKKRYVAKVPGRIRFYHWNFSSLTKSIKQGKVTFLYDNQKRGSSCIWVLLLSSLKLDYICFFIYAYVISNILKFSVLSQIKSPKSIFLSFHFLSFCLFFLAQSIITIIEK